MYSREWVYPVLELPCLRLESLAAWRRGNPAQQDATLLQVLLDAQCSSGESPTVTGT